MASVDETKLEVIKNNQPKYLKMKSTIIESGRNSPLVELNPQGELILQGRSIMEDTVVFYKPIIEWIKQARCNSMTVEVKMEYMNTSSSKQLLDIMRAVAANPNFNTVYIKWYYEEDEEDMLDLGRDYESLIHIPFDFYEYSAEAA
jgi:hypothetical protein